MTPETFIGLVLLAQFAGTLGALAAWDWLKARRLLTPLGRMMQARKH
jgi:hypothetical protein